VISVDGTLLPVAFAAALAGESSVEMRAHHQLVELAVGERRGLLWVEAVEDVVPLEPAPGETSADTLVAGWSGAKRPLPILDVPRLLELLG
jgi:phenylpropionate dioxygenase-like ring-hydroxylating dioxygenase large terminal subunit